MRVAFRLNGRPTEVKAGPTSFLVDVLRESALTGTKEGCGVGECGACTVLLDGRPVSSCLFLAPCADGAEVWTVEGLAERFPAVVDAFVTQEGMQCGICTPGQVAAVCGLALEQPDADENAIRDYLNGNLCR
ncbi:MAG: 2Fe-2S iron-sulfur cluster binding domain-containing protein, partial [Gemmatimonadetes bacterium]|nr:2Fe-2S iron-sulfur cluster binding domain-containing protein [Gemmatimonadota bacterium]NIS33394.1 2Fe-2S iron-sulfur cluster binding domain-containing protein [Actinomycetota bacterium]NIU68288.1 2Fe-2S iron-sulfur cluster binding domain-containing protein [Actinomycetota bacterium]NIW30103.1 2Fe-2S iron-sulfur cluster binding domain-containing protein [Actinomycetota bacterium]